MQAVASGAVGGGCIHDTYWLDTNAGRFFVKSSAATDGAAMLETEARGLECLAQSTLAVPSVLGQGSSPQGRSVLVLTWVESASPARDYPEQLGRGLALMHQQLRHPGYGWSQDNFIGRTPQPNGWMDSWVDFWRSHRLGYQLQLACQNGLLDSSHRQSIQRLLDQLDRWLGEPAGGGSLLHGDLWHGNVLVGSDGQPVLIDPAVYYGPAEAEFGMIGLFGGFEGRFHDAYHEILPRGDGFSERIELYKLYHLLNHLNLFGTSYLPACLDCLRQFS